MVSPGARRPRPKRLSRGCATGPGSQARGAQHPALLTGSLYFAAAFDAGRLRAAGRLAADGLAAGLLAIAPPVPPLRLQSLPLRCPGAGCEETALPSSVSSCCTRAGETLSAAA